MTTNNSGSLLTGAQVNGAAIKRWPSPEAKRWACLWLPEICSKGNVLAVVALGSAVRHVPSSSDLDLLVIFQHELPVLPNPPLDVDIRLYPAHDLDEKIEAGHDVLGWAVQFGAPVCEHAEFWSQFVVRWQHRLPLPDAEISDERAKRALDFYYDLQEIGDDAAADEQLLAALTHSARSSLLRKGIYPCSRPELPAQLREIGEFETATKLEQTIEKCRSA
jgi:hypothetical protein